MFTVGYSKDTFQNFGDVFAYGEDLEIVKTSKL